ncbi:MAG TPA: C13 family peptidase, partial [Methanothrix sp.]|nr:C13 family peptidase [Methanothrix sp.]
MRSNESRKLLAATTWAVTVSLLLLCSAGLSLGASLESTDDVKETTAVLKTSPMLKRAELIQRSPAIASLELLNRETAARLVQDAVVAPLWERADQRQGMRVLQHDEMLAEGAVIEPAFAPLGGPARRMVAQNQSWLFMVDELPGAHFAHPVKLVLVDAATGEQQEMETDWWPKVNDVQLFDTETIRTDPKLTTFYKKPAAEVKLSTSYGALGQVGEIKPLINCDVWAVLVCGYNDLPDSFDDDTNGMYSVLKNLGVPDDHIFYVSPHAGHAGVDRPTSRSNVQWAINEVAARSDIKDKVLFLYSSHGNVNFVSCVPGSPDGGSITADEMDNWLDAISCKEMAIIIEACHSGSFIGKYK